MLVKRPRANCNLDAITVGSHDRILQKLYHIRLDIVDARYGVVLNHPKHTGEKSLEDRYNEKLTSKLHRTLSTM